MAKRQKRNRHQDFNPTLDLVADNPSRYVRNITAMNTHQTQFIESLTHNPITIAAGPAGTGKTYLACVQAAEALMRGEVESIIITRPAISSASEDLGYLPGSLENKLNPFLKPCIQVLSQRLSRQRFSHFVKEGRIEFASFAHMRGRTFNNAFIIADEVQNLNVDAMKMLLTRLGFNSRMVLCGDLSQTDLPLGVASGLADAIERLQASEHVGVINFTDEDVVRSPVVADILAKY